MNLKMADINNQLCHELAGTAPAFFCACNNSTLYQPALQIVVQNVNNEHDIAK